MKAYRVEDGECVVANERFELVIGDLKGDYHHGTAF